MTRASRASLALGAAVTALAACATGCLPTLAAESAAPPGRAARLDEDVTFWGTKHYRLELSQDRYSPSIIEVMREARRAQVRQAKKDAELLAKVENLTVPDEELPPIKPRPKARRRK